MGFSFALGFVAGSGFQFAFAHTVGSALKDGDVGVMGEAVEKRRDAGGVGKNGVPVFEDFIGGEQDGFALVTLVDDFEEQVGGVGVIRQVATFIHKCGAPHF